jgi:predicted lipase
MIAKATIIAFFSKSKVMFATIAAIVTFSITVYNQFKTNKATEISGIVSVNKDFAKPVDAIVRISSPIQAQTETDSKGRFKFRLENLQSDTFLLIVQNKKTNTVAKQNEYVNASRGRTDIVVVFNSDLKDGGIFTSFDKGDTVHQNKRRPRLKNVLRQIFH